MLLDFASLGTSSARPAGITPTIENRAEKKLLTPSSSSHLRFRCPAAVSLKEDSIESKYSLNTAWSGIGIVVQNVRNFASVRIEILVARVC
jgi:hypothetical protein